tara:strand:- start:640 stop:906 length:267 start_codon:yes stop_codon:yes gene_type:complete
MLKINGKIVTDRNLEKSQKPKRKTKTQEVLEKLIRVGDRGVSVLDYPHGFRLAPHIDLLRKAGHGIETENNFYGKLCRYTLTNERLPF